MTKHRRVIATSISGLFGIVGVGLAASFAGADDGRRRWSTARSGSRTAAHTRFAGSTRRPGSRAPAVPMTTSRSRGISRTRGGSSTSRRSSRRRRSRASSPESRSSTRTRGDVIKRIPIGPAQPVALMAPASRAREPGRPSWSRSACTGPTRSRSSRLAPTRCSSRPSGTRAARGDGTRTRTARPDVPMQASSRPTEDALRRERLRRARSSPSTLGPANPLAAERAGCARDRRHAQREDGVRRPPNPEQGRRRRPGRPDLVTNGRAQDARARCSAFRTR